MKEANIIRDSLSPFNFPLVVVKKKREIEGSIKHVKTSENMFLPIPDDKLITHTAIREILTNNNIIPPQIVFDRNNKFIIINRSNIMIIFYSCKKTHYMEMNAENYFNAINGIK